MVRIGQCFDVCEDFSRLLKACIAFLLSNLAVALSFHAKHEVNQELSQITSHSGIVALLANIYTASFGVMWVVNIFCIIYTFLGIGCIRQCIFRERPDESTKCQKIQCCLGPACSSVLQILVWLTLLMQIAVSYGYLMVMVYLTFLLGICKAGHSTISAFQHLIDSWRNGREAPGWSPLNLIMNMNMEKYCYATDAIKSASSKCFLGCLLSVASQVLMIAIISEEKGRIEGTLGMGVQGGDSSRVIKGQAVKGGADDDDSSSSSSGSDYEATPPAPDPLAKFRQAGAPSGMPAGGRNYKLPSGKALY
mmetsp:Transcript_58163/g.104081  ORF Transcript_58163/g.104081 Transcript_58163/m.104081 type:complete len:307 (-) Transcript_58163:163-1083(-)